MTALVLPPRGHYLIFTRVRVPLVWLGGGLCAHTGLTSRNLPLWPIVVALSVLVGDLSGG